MTHDVSSDQKVDIAKKCREIERLAGLKGGCPWDPAAIKDALQAIVEGKFPGAKGASQEAQAPKSALLGLTGVVDGEAQELFTAADFFKEKGQPDVITFWFGNKFRTNFLGKVETGIPATELKVYNLRSASVDNPILTELGGEACAATSLAYMAQLLRKQAKGGEGVLLTNGWANVFYVYADDGVLWAVHCHWFSGSREWSVDAYPVTHPLRWSAGRRVFSPAVLAA